MFLIFLAILKIIFNFRRTLKAFKILTKTDFVYKGINEDITSGCILLKKYLCMVLKGNYFSSIFYSDIAAGDDFKAFQFNHNGMTDEQVSQKMFDLLELTSKKTLM